MSRREILSNNSTTHTATDKTGFGGGEQQEDPLKLITTSSPSSRSTLLCHNLSSLWSFGAM